jgi:site-specific DNA-methyltransferase (adenine-specific)
VRLVGGQKGSVILDPFMGSGTTGVACALEGFDFVGADLDPDHVEIARGRIVAAREEAGTLTGEDLDAIPAKTTAAQLGLLGGGL